MNRSWKSNLLGFSLFFLLKVEPEITQILGHNYAIVKPPYLYVVSLARKTFFETLVSITKIM